MAALPECRDVLVWTRLRYYYRTAGILKGLTLAMTRAEKSVVAPSHICVLTPTALLLAAIFSLVHIHIHIL